LYIKNKMTFFEIPFERIKIFFGKKSSKKILFRSKDISEKVILFFMYKNVLCYNLLPFIIW
jgi:hypothetical protein